MHFKHFSVVNGWFGETELKIHLISESGCGSVNIPDIEMRVEVPSVENNIAVYRNVLSTQGQHKVFSRGRLNNPVVVSLK